MKSLSKAVYTIFFIFLFSACAGVIPIKVNPPEDISVEVTPERIERGKYLVNRVTGCLDCHSTRNWDYF